MDKGKNMRGFKLGILAATALALLPLSAAHAQQVININGVEATRVVIGPATSPLAQTIKSGLKDDYYGARAGTNAWKDAQKLYYFYGERNFEPLWLDLDGDKIQFSDKAQSIIKLFEKAELEGLRPSDYLTDALDLTDIENEPERLAALETEFSQSAIRYAQHAAGGRINPRSVSRSITLNPTRIDGAKMLIDLVQSSDPAALLYGLHPTHREFTALRQELAKKLDGVEEEQIIIPGGQLLKLGRTDDRLPLLRTRLEVPASDPANEMVYDQAVVDAVEEFQSSLGLVPDGVVGPATIAALNGANGASVEDIIANMERWRWMPKDLGDFFVLVNVPEYRLEVRSGETVRHATRVVVGKPKHATPIFSDEIEHVVVNPYWNVPLSITKNELLPASNGNPGYFAARNYELLAGGRVINASNVDWANVNPSNPPFRVRQRPGRGNALGQIKFLFPNQHSVYLHDTPSKSLFSRSYRAFSHGCVRVHNPLEFADALLAFEPDLNLSKIKSMFGSRERWNNLKSHIPVHIAYFTLRVSGDGTIRSYGDVYGHHQRLINMLKS
jgi:murein L,D-transpeptidase YcbB/YkuD